MFETEKIRNVLDATNRPRLFETLDELQQRYIKVVVKAETFFEWI